MLLRGLLRRSAGCQIARNRIRNASSESPNDIDSIISRKGLLKTEHSHPKPTSVNPNKSPRTPLLDELEKHIKFRGPLTVSEYMRHALLHPRHGYYTMRDAIGGQADFITSPEITQIFGEIIGVWCVATWQQMGCPKSLRLVEIGPGTGSLMFDILKTVRKFPDMERAIEVDLVEQSLKMVRRQQEKLAFKPSAITSAPFIPAAFNIYASLYNVAGNKSSSPLLTKPQSKEADLLLNLTSEAKYDPQSVPEDERVYLSGTCMNSVPINWHPYLAAVPAGPSLIIAHEFFDALPVHQFVHTERGWCERLVDLDEGEGEHHLRFVLSGQPSTATMAYVLKNNSSKETPPEGSQLEICPEAMAVSEDIAKRFDAHPGAALIIDYGDNHPMSNTLQGVKNHQYADVLSEPGLVDLTTHVDFSSILRQATKSSRKVKGYGPIPQVQFLSHMGMLSRLENLMNTIEDEEKRNTILSAVERLVDPDQMGVLFKAISLAHESIEAPPGFWEAPKTDSS
eukprot:TRINITY_DN780_c0_g1_i4.p1 TRINITY_DN780_c0_g1~~TRINITY_DN780_c0_g1_i4.p1  ORF type:complete len:510 (-),score=82.11 TRINITY_DN780_c0_g1_i4:36-1565(-)